MCSLNQHMLILHMKPVDLRGVFPPIPTAFDDNGNINLHHIQQNIKALLAFDIYGIVILGSNGEYVFLDEDEKIEIIKAAKDVLPKNKPLIAGLGCPSTRATIRLCQRAKIAGADAALIISPSYYKGKMTEHALEHFFVEVANDSPIPIILYNMPACTGIDLSAKIVISLSNHPNIIGIKDSGGDVAKFSKIVECGQIDFQLLAGSAGFFLSALNAGAVGGIMALANIAPQDCIEIHHLHLAGKQEKASIIQNRIIELNQAVTRKGGGSCFKKCDGFFGFVWWPCSWPIITR